MDTTIEKQNSVGEIIGQAFSALLHPLLMPTLVFFLILFFCPIAINISQEASFLVLRNIFITTFIFPILCIFVFIYVVKRSFSFNDLIMENHRERFLPFLFTGIFYTAVTYLYLVSGYKAIIVNIMGGISLTIIAAAIITYFYKISIHAIGIAGVIGVLLVVSYYYPYDEMLYALCAVIFIAGILMSVRLYLGAHTPSQIFFGAVVGLIINMLFFILFQRYGYPFFNL